MSAICRSNRKLIEALQASWANPDPASFSSLFTEDGEFEDVPYAICLKGRDALHAHAQRMKKHNVSLGVEILTCDATKTTGVAEWIVSHDYVRTFDGVDCTGRPVRLRGLSLYRFTDGLISLARDYWNYMEMVRAMGVIPREIREFRTA